MTATLTQPPTFSPRALAETCAAFRDECGNFDSIAGELYSDIERLSGELVQKATEVDLARRQIEDRERQLTEQRQENAQLGELIEAQQALLETTVSEIQSFRRHAAEELSELRRQLTATQSQLGETRTQLRDAMTRAAEAAQHSSVAKSGPLPLSDESRARFTKLEHECRDLQEENKLLRTRAAALQETVNKQRRELSDQQAEISTELKQLRELLAHRNHEPAHVDQEAMTLVGAVPHAEAIGEPDPVVSSVMAQFARLQKDVAQRRKKK